MHKRTQFNTVSARLRLATSMLELGSLIFFYFQFRLCGNQLVGMLNLICSMRWDGKLGMEWCGILMVLYGMVW